MAEIDHSKEEGGSGFKNLFKIAYGVARKKGLKHEDAEEVANTTIATISKRWPDMESSEELVPLTYKIANDETVTLMRKGLAQKRDSRMTKPGLDMAENIPDSETGPVENLQKKELGERVRQMLQHLSERDEEVIKDKYFQDLSFKEIADKRGIPMGSVGVIIMRALRILRGLGENPDSPIETTP